VKDSKRNIKLTSYDELFKTEEGRADEKREKVMDIMLEELHPFRNHPFKVRDDASMLEMVESIEKHGVLIPSIARPREEGGYELIAGHRRKRASELAGLDTMPVIIREMDDDAATIIMVDSNIQRENLMFSERALAYKMKMEAMQRQGERGDLTSRQVGEKLTAEIVGQPAGDSARQVQRYIRLTELIPPVLEMVDEKKMAFNPAVEVSYLDKQAQEWLIDVMEQDECTPSLSQAQRLKKYGQEGKLDRNIMEAIMSEEKPQQNKLTIKGDRLSTYFPKGTTPKQMEDTIFKLLDAWHKKRQHEQSR